MAALLAALAVSIFSPAVTPPAPVDVTATPMVQQMVTMAEQYWGATPACGPVSVVVKRMIPTIGGDGQPVPLWSIAAETYLNSCEIDLSPWEWFHIRTNHGWWTNHTSPRAFGCTLIAHEYGHALGLPDIATGAAPAIMQSAFDPTADPACVAAFR